MDNGDHHHPHHHPHHPYHEGPEDTAVDLPETSVDNISAADEYGDDNIEDIDAGAAAAAEAEAEDVHDQPSPPSPPLNTMDHNNTAVAEELRNDCRVEEVDETGQGEHEEAEEESRWGERGRDEETAAAAAAAGVVAMEMEQEEEGEGNGVLLGHQQHEDDHGEGSRPMAASTPAAASSHKGKKSGKTPSKTFKQRLGEIPARLSKISILNSLRSGTYMVNEPPPTPPEPGNNHNIVPEDAQRNAEEGNPPPTTTTTDNTTSRMTDNGVVANEDTTPAVMTKMPEETHPEVGMLPDLPPIPKGKTHSVHRSALTKLLCGLYALTLVVFGVVFAVANSLTVKERHHLYYLEVFLIYLYAGSLATLLYFQLGILRGKQVRNAYLDNSIRVVIRRSQDNLQLSPTPNRRDNMPPRGDLEDRDMGLEPRKEPMDQMSTMSNASDFRSHLVLPPDGQVAHVGEGINFYLRLGCLAFSIGSVTLDGFHIASYFETENTTTCESHVFIMVYVLHLIFTFIQTFFLFKNHKLVIDKNKASVRFGLMHLLATNLCIWFITAVTETNEDYRQQDYLSSRNMSDVPALKSCYEDMTLARTASPYLFPCTIIYSIIAAGIVYRMYTYVGIKVKQRWPSHTSLTSSAFPQGVVSMDCEKANKGLFSGLLVAVVTLIAIATFFVFDSRLNNPQTAIKVFFIMEISLLLLTGGCILVGCVRFTKLRFLENYLSLDSVLLLVSLAGAYIYLCFMLISSASTLQTHGLVSVLSLVTICISLVQATLQAVFVLDGLCRRADNDMQVEKKPGRAVVTFLLVCNLALWVVTLFEIRKTIVVPFHLNFYGILPWNIILHLCVPLYIYYRFHSAICLSKIWFNAYQKGDRFA